MKNKVQLENDLSYSLGRIQLFEGSTDTLCHFSILNKTIVNQCYCGQGGGASEKNTTHNEKRQTSNEVNEYNGQHQ